MQATIRALEDRLGAVAETELHAALDTARREARQHKTRADMLEVCAL